MNTLKQRIEDVSERITRAAEACGRVPGSIRLLAVSKGCSVDAVRQALACGLPAFGENYLQEAIPKIDAAPEAEWHYIGRIQSNKTRTIAERFDWVQTVATLKVADRLSSQRPGVAGPLQVCIQVNIDDDPGKAGCRPADVVALADAIAQLPRLRLRGLMTIPRVDPGTGCNERSFARMYTLYEECRAYGHAVDTLSMGMTGDLEAAIAAGSTMVRVGTAIFGPRD